MTRQKPRPSPYRWLWDEIARRFGEEAAQQLKAGYAAQSKAYQRDVWHGTPSPPQPRAKPPKKNRR